MKNILKQICKNKPHSIEAEVVQEALEYEDSKSFFSDLQQHGCISGFRGIQCYDWLLRGIGVI